MIHKVVLFLLNYLYHMFHEYYLINHAIKYIISM